MSGLFNQDKEVILETKTRHLGEDISQLRFPEPIFAETGAKLRFSAHRKVECPGHLGSLHFGLSICLIFLLFDGSLRFWIKRDLNHHKKVGLSSGEAHSNIAEVLSTIFAFYPRTSGTNLCSYYIITAS
jgi:hypothetical protein